MRITVFSKLFWPEGGGAELATYTLVRDVFSKYFDVTVVSGTEGPQRDILECCRYVHWSVLRTRFKPVEWLKLFPNSHVIRELVAQTDIIYIPSHTLLPLAIIIKRVKPNAKVVLHLHNYQPLTFTSVLLARREPDLATDIIVELGESRSLFRAIASGVGHYMNILNRVALRYADKVICVSRRQCELIEKYIPELRGRTVVVYNPLPPIPNIEKDPDVTPTILYIGGGSYIKGFHIAVKAFAEILAKHACRAYIIYGRSMHPEQIELLERFSKRFNEKLRVLGKLPHEEMPKLYSKAWILLFPSINEEPLPYAVLESMAVGTPPIASRVGGVLEIVESSPAENYLFSPENIQELLDRVERIVTLSKEELVELGTRLREHVRRKFNATETTEKLLTHINNLLE